MIESPALVDLPARDGPGPQTNPHMPHTQVSQNSPTHLQERLFERVVALPGVVVGRSHVSVPGARAFHLDREHANGSREAFMAGTEFAHLHPPYDGSLHVVLPEPLAANVIAHGWGEFHPLVAQGVMPPTNLMVFGPRNDLELDVAWRIIQAAYANATGTGTPPG